MGELVKRLVDSNRDAIIQRLPKYMTETQFFALLYNLDRKPKLAEVAQRNPESLLKAIFQAADCGLLIGSAYGHCELATFGNEFQLMIQYQGIIYQLMRAGAVLSMEALIVYTCDDIKVGLHGIERYDPDLKNPNRRNWKWENDKNNMIGALASARLPMQERPGEFTYQDHFSSIGEIERARDISKNKSPDGPWAQHYGAMAMKTAIRRLSKFIVVCGPTAENHEAWDRFGRTMELEDSSYRRIPEELQPDDDPGLKPRKSSPKSGRAAAGSTGSEHVTPPPQNDGERKSSAAPTPPPTQEQPKPEAPKAPPDEVISTERQYEILQQAAAAGMKTMAFLKHVAEKFGVDLAELRQSQAAELSKYIKDMAKSAE
jgi:phage RecT family recombinase